VDAAPSEKTGKLVFLKLDLGDLASIKASAEEFLAKEPKLNILWNNAGVAYGPTGSRSKQGYELPIAINCFGTHLFTQCLLPALERAAKDGSQPGSVRVVWAGSLATDLYAMSGSYSTEAFKHPESTKENAYAMSKLATNFLAFELGRRVRSSGILSVVQNPGLLKTQILRDAPRSIVWQARPMMFHARFGAYTELWAGLTEDIGLDDQGVYVAPWGRRHPGEHELLKNGVKSKDEGGTGLASECWEFCEEVVKAYK
jgi:NAD(P)-dependent dehydrogenase (short-subunit alcohol dehydrogenase family)